MMAMNSMTNGGLLLPPIPRNPFTVMMIDDFDD
jgi:hypothetical protein